MELYDKITEASTSIQSQLKSLPKKAIILGTGLGSLAGKLVNPISISYTDIPHFVKNTVDSHEGKLHCGELNGCPVIILQGRFHYYEGYDMQEVTFPVRVLARLGVEQLIITNASGSLNPAINTGDIIAVSDHISTFVPNPLRGITDPRLGERFPDMTHTYDGSILAKVIKIGKENNISVTKGIYVFVEGPSLETPAEHKLLRTAGADVVGMSTVPEVIVARQCGMQVCVMSCVTNECLSIEGPKETSLEEVIAAAELASPKLLALISKLVATT